MFYAPAVRSSFFSPVFGRHNGAASRHSDRFFDDAFDLVVSSTKSGVRLEQDDKSYTLSLDVPGLAKEHLSIEIEEAVVRVRSQDDAPRSLRVAYELPAEIDASASQATVAHGVLTLRLVKKVPQSKAVVLAIN